MRRLLLFVAVAFAAADLAAGHTYQFESVFRSEWSNDEITGLATVDGRKVRIDFVDGDDFLFPDAGILLSSDGEKFQVFDPAAMTYYDVTLGVLLNPASGLTKAPDGSTIELYYTDPKVEVKDHGDGGEVAGFRTRRYTVRTSYDMHMTLMGELLSNHFEITADVWATDELPAGSMTFLQMQGLRLGVDALDKLMEPRAIRGFPVKHVLKHTGTYGAGKSRTWTMETKVTAVRKTTVAASQFERPAGYTRVERPSVMQEP